MTYLEASAGKLQQVIMYVSQNRERLDLAESGASKTSSVVGALLCVHHVECVWGRTLGAQVFK